MKALRFCIVACFVLFLASCGVKPAWDVVGKWQKVGGTETLDFQRNGTVTITNGGAPLTAGYKFADPKHLQISFGSLGSLNLEATMAEGTLTIKDASGKAVKYTKATAAVKQPAAEAPAAPHAAPAAPAAPHGKEQAHEAAPKADNHKPEAAPHGEAKPQGAHS